MRVQAIKCPKCADTIFSRVRHDMRYCSCRAVAVDGGTNYTRLVWNKEEVPQPEPFPLDIISTLPELYEDWNFSRNKYGIIREGETPSYANKS